MKIVLLHYASAPVIGGVETVLAAHVALLREHGHDVILISQRGDANVRLNREQPAKFYRQILAGVLQGCALAIVHNVMTMPFDLELTAALEQLAGDLPRTRFLAWVHDVAAVNPDLVPVPEILQRAVSRFNYVAVSEARAREFEGVTGVAARVVPNGIDPARVLGLTPEIAAFAERFSLFDGAPILLHPTRLLRRKNVEFGIQVINELRATGARLLVTAAADPYNADSKAYAAWLRSESARLQAVDRVIFISDLLRVADTELSGLYKIADALFLPSRQEGFGLPAHEAALHRIPAFVSDIDSLREVAGANTWTFSLESSAADVASLITSALQNDAPTQARKRALQFRWSRIYELYLAPLLSGI